MKRIAIILCLLLNVAGISIALQSNLPASDSDEEVIKRCAARVSTSLVMAYSGMPAFDVTTSVDSLYQRLVVNPTEIKLAIKYSGMIPMQAFFLLMNDSRADYSRVEECLAVCGKFDPFLDLPFLICAIYYGDQATDPSKACTAYLLADKANEIVYGGTRSLFSDMINLKLSHIYSQEKEWDKAIKYQQRLIDNCPKDREEYLSYLTILGYLNKMGERYAEADSCYKECQEYLEGVSRTDTEDYIDIILNRAEIKIEEGKYDEAEQLLCETEQKIQPGNPLMTEIWQELTTIYHETGAEDKAIEIFRKVLTHYEKGLTEEDIPTLSKWIIELDNPNAGKECIRIQRLIEKQLPTEDLPTLCALCQIYHKRGEYDKANNLYSQIEQLTNGMDWDRIEEYSDPLMHTYLTLNKFSELIEMSKIELDTTEKLVGKQHPLYRRGLALSGEYYMFNGDYYNSLERYKECLSLEDLSEEETSSIYERIAMVYSEIGEYELSNQYLDYIISHTTNPKMLEKALTLYLGNLISESDIARSDLNESSALSTDSIQRLALDRALELNNLCIKRYGETHIKTIESYQLLASAYNLAGDNDNMIKIADKTEKIIRKNVLNRNLRQTYLESLAAFYIYVKDYKKARSLIDVDILTDPNSPSIFKDFTLLSLSEISLMEGKGDESRKYYEELARMRMSELSQQMSMLKSQSRQQYWRKYRQEMQNGARYASKWGEPDEYSGVIYDLSLYSKRLLIGSDRAFRNAILQSGDKSLIDKYDQLNRLRIKLTENRSGESAEEYQNNQMLASQIEKELLKAVKSEDYAEQNIHWQDVRDRLDNESIAIEMLEYKNKEDKGEYGVVMIRKDWDNPIVLQLGNKDQTDQQLAESSFIPESGRAVWGKIMPYLEGVTKIYFSPIGIFHRIPIEYMEAVDHYSIYRVSSTAELCTTSDREWNRAVVYGGLLYKEGLKQSETLKTEDRGSITLPYLAGTLAEANAIYSIMSPRYKVELKQGMEGTEESLKSYSGEGIGLLHIGTHGQYTEYNKSGNRLLKNVVSKDLGEDPALTRSCLFMSGALDALKSADENDGILTALEVSTLDFRGLDMVTLSACETAKGDITGDGVFGMQRGFKKAGANSILMSLRKVNDKATQVLMTDFYTQLSEGKPKQEALRHAQAKIRQTPEWDKPEYWASFILLDALK